MFMAKLAIIVGGALVLGSVLAPYGMVVCMIAGAAWGIAVIALVPEN